MRLPWMSWPWPLPAVLVWLSAWGLYLGCLTVATPVGLAMALATTASVGVAWSAPTAWRRVFMGAGFPLSWALLQGAGQLPTWAWLVMAMVLVVLYPPSVWRDAPLYPTHHDALVGLSDALPLLPMAWVLDAGAGAGDGLRALERTWPDARLVGIERSWPLVWLARLRCRRARVIQGDMWALDWTPFDVVYLFQRPESMPQAMAKAQAELRNEAWLVSLAFDAPGWIPYAVLDSVQGRAVWVYRGQDIPRNGSPTD